MLCLYIEGKFADNSLVYWCAGVIAPGLAILISLKHDHSLKELGLYPNHLKRDSAVMLCAFAAELLICNAQTLGWHTGLPFEQG